MIKTKRPIIFMDLETSGTDVQNDRIVEISFVKYQNGEKEIKTRRINPGIPIPKEAQDVHGISDDDVKNCPSFFQVAKSLYDYIQGCDIAGFNSNRFDVPMLYNEFQHAGIDWDYSDVNFIDVGNLFKILNPRTLSAAVLHYLGREHEDAHGAEADTIGTLEVLEKMLETEDIPKEVEELALFSNYDMPILDISGKFSTNKDGEIIFNFGKYRGEPANEHLDFVLWMRTKDFPTDTLRICQRIIAMDNLPFE